MACKNPTIYRVEDDEGPPITVEHEGLITTGLTITARFTKPNGVTYTIPAVVNVVGDGADTPAEYQFDFSAGDLSPEGNHTFDVAITGASIADYSYPAEGRIIMKVRHNG
jgi:hypothetical protein